jgi:hypothetical protein
MSNAHDTLIGHVPPRIIDSARQQVTPFEGRISEFNIAAWLQIPGLANLPVSLMVSYRDGETKREVSVDHGKVNSVGKVLLSGIARIPVKTRIEGVQVRLHSAVPTKALIVEELFVQPVELLPTAERLAFG